MNFLTQQFDRPAVLWLLLLAVLMWWMARRSLAGLGPIRSRLSLLVRTVVVLLLVLALAGMYKILKNDELTVLFLVDESRSIPAAERTKVEEFIKSRCREMPHRDHAAVLTFDGLVHIEQLPARPNPEQGLQVATPFGEGGRPDRTNLAQALRMASACTLDSTVNRVVLITDGNQNTGDVLEEAKTAAANNLVVDVLPVRYEHGAEVMFEQLRAPAYAHLDEQVPLRLIIKSEQRTSGSIIIYQRVGQEEEPIDLSPGREGLGQHVDLNPGRNPFTVRLPIKAARAHQFRAEFVPDDKDGDAVAKNNVAQAFTNVEGPATVLFIGRDEGQADDAPLVEALKREKIDVQWQPVEGLRLDSSVLQDYSAVILANVPADEFRGDQQQALANYVRDLGGGLIMLGGNEGFGAGGWQGSVIEDIMPIKFDVEAIKQIPRGALAIVVHACEMPEGNKWGVETAVAAAKTLSRLDYFGVVDWSFKGYQWEVPMQPLGDKEAVIAKLRKMVSSDMPDFNEPMEMAYKALMNCKDASARHMIVISDGDPAPPSSGLINRMKGHGITCSTVSVFPHGGWEIQTLKKIAEQTGGTYYSLSQAGDEKRLPRIFIKEAKIVRRPLIREEEFQPRVSKASLSDIMVGITDSPPKLHGYVVTTPREKGNFQVDMPLTTSKGDPLLAHWQCGFGRTVAFTSGWWGHWGGGWTSWPGFSKLWAQAVRWSMQQGTAANYDVSTAIDGDRGHVVIENIGEDQGFANFQQFVGRAVRPDGSSINVPIVQTGPGRYEANFDAQEEGTYLLNIQTTGDKEDKPVTIRTGVTVSYSPEFKDLSTNEGLLRQVADTTGGRLISYDADAKTVFAHIQPPRITRKPIWDKLLKWAIVFFLLDVAVRRVALDPIKMAAMARAYIASLPGRLGVGRQAQEVLTDLKGVRERVREEKTGQGDTGTIAAAKGTVASVRRKESEPRAPASEAGPTATAKFDAGTAAGKPTGKLTDVMGGAEAPKPGAGPAKATEQKKDEPQESVTSRLLKAKKQVQQRMEEEKRDE